MSPDDRARSDRRGGPLPFVLAVLTAPIPFAFVGRETWFAGLPLWLWWSLGFTVALSWATFRALRAADWGEDDGPDGRDG